MKKKKDWYKPKTFLKLEYNLKQYEDNYLGWDLLEVKYIGIDPYGNPCAIIAMVDGEPMTFSGQDYDEILECYKKVNE